MKRNNRTILFIPSVRKGNGTGHLRRCLEMATIVNGITAGASSASLAVEPGPDNLADVASLLDAFPTVPVVDGPFSVEPEFTVVDRRESSSAYILALKGKTTVIGLDEGGSGRGSCDYLIDTLPEATHRSEPNIHLPAAIAPRNRRTDEVTAHESIIVTFGGEDPAGLTPLVCRSLVEEASVAPERITAVRGPSAPDFRLPGGITVLERPAHLREKFCRFDLAITSHGLTAYEALAAGVSVLLVNPSMYHKKLSRREGFPEAGVGKVSAAKLRKVLDNPNSYRMKMEKLRAKMAGKRWSVQSEDSTGAAEIVASLSVSGSSVCPVCGTATGREVARFHSRTYFRCTRCGLVFLLIFDGKRASYDESYFFEEYKAQYGRTYLEDFSHIKEMARSRLKKIGALVPEGGTLLDVGCAYGPFLAAAGEQGFDCFGIDISPPAVQYVAANLGFRTAALDFLSFDPARQFEVERFDCLTMWYVIEHFEELNKVLALAAKIVRPGGAFAFSTPNFAGISGKRSLNKFLESSPRDHFTIWSPRTARRLLADYGFTVRKIRVTGHHPERFPLASQTGRGVMYGLLMFLSRIFRLGDTFEVYALRSRGARDE